VPMPECRTEDVRAAGRAAQQPACFVSACQPPDPCARQRRRMPIVHLKSRDVPRRREVRTGIRFLEVPGYRICRDAARPVPAAFVERERSF